MQPRRTAPCTTGRRVGGFGHFGCFSFYATKNMITGEGGMVTTGDKASAERLHLIINHGQSEKYLHTRLGYNYRMTDIAAAIGLVQLKKLEKFNQRRRKNAEYYSANLAVDGLVTPVVAAGMEPVWHQYVVRLTEEFPMNRAEFMDYLKAKGIGSAVHYPIPMHRQPLYRAWSRTRIPARFPPALPLRPEPAGPSPARPERARLYL